MDIIGHCRGLPAIPLGGYSDHTWCIIAYMGTIAIHDGYPLEQEGPSQQQSSSSEHQEDQKEEPWV